MVHLSQLMNEYCLIIINKSLYFIEIALAFNLMYFTSFRIPRGHHRTFSHHASLGSFWLWQETAIIFKAIFFFYTVAPNRLSGLVISMTLDEILSWS